MEYWKSKSPTRFLTFSIVQQEYDLLQIRFSQILCSFENPMDLSSYLPLFTANLASFRRNLDTLISDGSLGSTYTPQLQNMLASAIAMEKYCIRFYRIPPISPVSSS